MQALDFKLKILVLSWKKRKERQNNARRTYSNYSKSKSKHEGILYTSVFLSQNRSMLLSFLKEYWNLSYRSEREEFFYCCLWWLVSALTFCSPCVFKLTTGVETDTCDWINSVIAFFSINWAISSSRSFFFSPNFSSSSWCISVRCSNLVSTYLKKAQKIAFPTSNTRWWYHNIKTLCKLTVKPISTCVNSR